MADEQGSAPLRHREDAAAPPAEDPRDQGQNPFLWVHQLLRGRYRWAVPLAVILAIALGATGYHMVTPVYQSTGLLQVIPVLPRVLYETEEKDVPMFDAYIQTQLRLIESADLRDRIAQDEDWQEVTGLGPGNAEPLLLSGNLTAMRPKGSQMIEVSFTHPDPEVARATVDAAIEAYMALRQERAVQNDNERLQVLRERRDELNNQIQDYRDRVHEIANQFGSDTLREMYRFKVEQMQQLEAQLNEAESMLAAARASDNNEASEQAPSRGISDMQLTELAQIDAQMREYLARRDELSDRLKELTQRFGESHPQVEQVRNQLEIAEQRVQQHAQELRSGGLDSVGPGTAAVTGAGMDPERLEARVKELRDLYQKRREEAIELGRKNLQIQRLRDRIASAERRLEQTKTRIEELQIESTVGGRVRTLSRAGVSDNPINQSTRLQATVLGAGAGGGLGFGIVALFGLLSPRFRDSADAGSLEAPLLGVLPRLPSDLSRSNAAAVAVDCVHHVRLMLQLGARGGKRARALTVTSPDNGTGKTNLTLALGLSYASSNARTLLMDCDLTGHGLTHQAGAMIRRNLEETLRREGLVEEDQLQQASLLASSTGRPLGEVLIESRALSQEDLQRVWPSAREPHLGLLDAIDGEPLERCVTRIGDDRLSILPAGSGRADDAGRISPAAFETLLNQARKQFDVILIDTGPIPGGLDASMVAAQADAVLVVASRGDRRRSVEQCVHKLRAIGARIAGLVFNRADTEDLARSGYRSAYGQPSSGAGRRVEPADLSHVSRVGLLAGAVATMTRPTNGSVDQDPMEQNGDRPG